LAAASLVGDSAFIPAGARAPAGTCIQWKSAMNRNWKMVGLSAALVIAFVVLREHWGHVLGALPYLLLLACPLLHLFHGHGDRAHHDHSTDDRKP